MLQDENAKLQVWDTSGKEDLLSKSIYKDAVGAFLVFDITNRATFSNLPKQLTELKKNADPNICILIVGNKSDLEAMRQISTAEAQDFAQEHGLAYIETSAKSDQNVQETFSLMMQAFYSQATSPVK